MSLIQDIRTLLSEDDWQISEQIQSLWSDYGGIVRITHPKTNRSLVVKHVNPPNELADHPRGWNTQTSHQRKILSYQVENTFYQDYAPLVDAHCYVPQLMESQCEGQQRIMLMEDLDDLGYFVRKDEANWHTVQLGITWLAFFHARFMFAQPKELWPSGTYWHLATRQDEWHKMPSGQLKESAKVIDEKLAQSEFKTLVHGDAKLANFCLHHTGERLAAVDFQYVGGGTGVKDLAYFVGSCLNEAQLYERQEQILDEYFCQIRLALSHYGTTIDADALEREYRQLYPLAWADFERFLLGWNPSSWKLNGYMTEQTKQALTQL